MAIKTSTIVIVGLIIIVLAFATGYLSFKSGTITTGPAAGNQPTSTPTTAGSMPLTLNVPFFIFNGTQVTAGSTCPQALLFQSPVGINTFVGSSSSGAAITGSIDPSQQYDLLVAPASAGTYGTLDNMVASSGNGVIIGASSVVTYQGSYYTEYPVTFNVAKISTGLTASINLYGYTAETAGTTSLLNSTAIPASGLGTATTTAYFSGWANNNYGQGYKIVRMELNMSSANATAYDNGAFTLKSVTINMGNGQSITTSTVTQDPVITGYIEIGAANGATYLCGTNTVPQYQYNALPVLYGQSDSASGSMTIVLNWAGSSPGSGNSLVYSLKLVAMTPTGALATTYSGGSVS
jgi:hypothetical protein